MSAGERPLLEIVDVRKVYRLPRPRPFAPHPVRVALHGVSLSVIPGRSFGIVGESGSGKTTLARIALALDRPDSGVVRLEGASLFDLPRRELRALRAHMQLIFQDPYGSLDPRMRVERIVAEPLAALGGVSRAERRDRVAQSLQAVGLRAADAAKYPHEFSGGQRQRIAIARALITRPKLVVADEPVSALDVSVQAQALNLMSDLVREAGVTFLLISHDLGVVAHICETTAVMYRGRIVEIGPTDAVFAAPAHPYTRELVDATPRLDLAARTAAPADRAPAAHARAGGCPYAPRCATAEPRCLAEAPTLTDIAGEGRRAACHFPLGLDRKARR
jgi:peptide/nickel transport system ATP-binding protein